VGPAPCALPSGTLDPGGDRTLERALRRWVAEQTGIDLGYVEQLYSLGDRDRGPAEGERLVTVAYLALVREGPVPRPVGGPLAQLVRLLPLGGLREGPPPGMEESIVPSLERWSAAGDQAGREARRERLEIHFGRGDPSGCGAGAGAL